MESEILSDEELAMITGYQARAWQRRWLNSHGWHYIEGGACGYPEPCFATVGMMLETQQP